MHKVHKVVCKALQKLFKVMEGLPEYYEQIKSSVLTINSSKFSFQKFDKIYGKLCRNALNDVICNFEKNEPFFERCDLESLMPYWMLLHLLLVKHKPGILGRFCLVIV